jgi:hypothetical protein
VTYLLTTIEIGDRWEMAASFPPQPPGRQIAIVAGFDELLSTPLLRDVELLEHQLRTARVVLRRMRDRALLCDEVGPGKTVEVGMITLELAARGLARRTLILTPPPLVEQWQGELRRKFGLDSIVYDDPAYREQGAAAWGQHERIVASYHTAKREPHRMPGCAGRSSRRSSCRGSAGIRSPRRPTRWTVPAVVSQPTP